MRVFVALELPELMIDDIAEISRQLSVSCKGRFLSRETYHLTLAFLGEIGEPQVRDAMDAIDVACGAMQPIELRPDGLGLFGRANDGTLWLGVEDSAELQMLAQRVREELRARDLSLDAKVFKPHITLARRVKLPDGQLPMLPFPQPAYATRVTLFRSILSSEGASYKALYSVEWE